MVYSKKWTSVSVNVQEVLILYRSKKMYSIKQIAEELRTTESNVWWVTRNHLPKDEFKTLKSLRYSMSKLGDKNPMKGLTGEKAHQWKGVIDDGHGYKTILHNGKRIFYHHYVFCQALGLQMKLPPGWEIHHIDENPHNNELDNLALVTGKGHRAIHSRQRQDSKSLTLKKLRLAEAAKYLT